MGRPKKDKSEEVKKKVDVAIIEMLKEKVGLTKSEAGKLKLANEYISVTDVISTGHGVLDSIIHPDFFKKHGRGGVPRGFLCEFFGPNSGGKSSICLMMAARVTKSGGYVFWVDAEHSFIETWAENHGVDLSHVVMCPDCDDAGNPFTGEQYLEQLEKYAGSGVFQLAVVDSMEALVPKAILEGKLEENARIGEKARLMSRALPRIMMASNKGNCTTVFINQIRQNIMASRYSGNPETTPGGEALRFYASLRLRISQVSGKDKRGIVKDGEEIGIRSNVLIKKSRFGPPYKETVVPIYYGDTKPHPFDMLLDDLLGCGLIRCRTGKDKEGDPIQVFFVKDDDGKPFEGLEDIVRVEGLEDLKAKLDTKKLNIFMELLLAKKIVPDPEVTLWLKTKAKDDDPLAEASDYTKASEVVDDIPPEDEDEAEKEKLDE